MSINKYNLSRRDREDVRAQLKRFEKECGPVITVQPAVYQQTPVAIISNRAVASVHQIAQSSLPHVATIS